MEKKSRHTDVSRCVHCGKCTKSCTFLSKYEIDIGSAEKLKELSYHCFLCGKCSEVCPVGIDGRQVILDIRRAQVRENGGSPPEKGYGMLLWEKKDYRFRNYKNGGTESVLFPGCNFPSFYPATTRYLSRLLWEEAGIGTVYDCCGKPIAELGLEDAEAHILEKLDKSLKDSGVREIIVLCPNCYAFFEGRLSVKVSSIYEKLAELGLGQPVEGVVRIFPPCPDRERGALLSHIKPFLMEEPEILSDSQCSGLGGCGGVREPALAAGMAGHYAGKDGAICTYCGSCSGNLARGGHKDTEHLLVKILGRAERADTKRSLVNRIKTKYRKEKRV